VAKGGETAESDVDLMVIGESLTLADIVPALRKAQLELRREVNPSVYRTEEFYRKLAERHHFLTSVVAGPKIFLIGDERELKRLAENSVGKAAPAKSARDRRSPRRR
jgi:predicted nucleotidyltransferase